ncbi:hypothetical protein GBAR_LOCUS10668 [Geodia barretti]|uniref:Uncharacterized protein n=1 Tax=Geodia barretti TaxID=519541 RepID=A0AA35WKC9_GEOBA|nr:hypothetical protein GBAR_LOCUS10668 [Geodia barretti]
MRSWRDSWWSWATGAVERCSKEKTLRPGNSLLLPAGRPEETSRMSCAVLVSQWRSVLSSWPWPREKRPTGTGR